MADFFTSIFGHVLEIFLDASIFVLFGFTVAGLLHVFIPADRMRKFLGSGKYAPVLKASIIGLPLPLCSCGVLPAAMGLRRQGAGKGATVSFLISTPETSVDSIALSFALLDPIMAIFRPIAAFLTALVTGFACDRFASSEKEEEMSAFKSHACCSFVAGGEADSFRTRLKHGAHFAFVEMMEDLGKWLLIGIVIAAVITTLVPEDYFSRIPGGRPVMMLVMLVVGIPLYMCSTSSTPLAASLIIAGVSPGAALVLLLTGPATNSASIIVVARDLGRKVALIYLASIASVSIIMGILLDVAYDGFIGRPAFETISKSSEALPEGMRIGGAVVLAGLLLWVFASRFILRRRDGNCGCEHEDH